MWGRLRKGSCVTREAGDSSHLLMPYKPVCTESMYTRAHPASPGDRLLHPSRYKCVKRTPLEWSVPRASVATQESPYLREVLMLRSPKVNRHQYQRGKLTRD